MRKQSQVRQVDAAVLRLSTVDHGWPHLDRGQNPNIFRRLGWQTRRPDWSFSWYFKPGATDGTPNPEATPNQPPQERRPVARPTLAQAVLGSAQATGQELLPRHSRVVRQFALADRGERLQGWRL